MRHHRRTTRGTRRTASLAALLAVVVVLAGACVGQHDPTGYGAGVRTDFVTGCVEGYAPTDGSKDPDVASHKELCGCIYDEMSSKSTGIPFDEFKSAQSAIREDPQNPANRLDKLIPKFPKFVSSCKGKTEAGPQTS